MGTSSPNARSCSFCSRSPHRYFSEKEGVEVGQVCQKCHGDVAAMEKVQQVENLKMGDCVSCHKDNGAPTDCTTCHY